MEKHWEFSSSNKLVDNKLKNMNLNKLQNELYIIYKKMVEMEPFANELANKVQPDYRLSAKNLYRYLILRNHDLRKLHDTLSDIGVSSLRTSEGYVLSNIYNVLKILRRLQNNSFNEELVAETIGYKGSKALIKKHANLLFNATEKSHFTEIMVTLPAESADDINLVSEMVANGMEIARINLSHGDEEQWLKMIKNVRKVKKETNSKIKIYMDLSGPKIRTAKIEITDKSGKIKDHIRIQPGEHIILTKRKTLGEKSKFDDEKNQIKKAEVGVLLTEIIDDVQVGDMVLFDDGMIKSEVVAKTETDVELVIKECYKSRLGSNKGINLPNTKLNLPALTSRDIELLPFVAKHADLVGYSFVRNNDDVKQLYQHLGNLNAEHLGVIFKIENKEAFENLPQILLQGMKHNKIGVMIARGDLAVELGFERISEVQNQILWICEAAHIPVIWATQVLENLAKTGIPTRAEITDAVQSANAECVMLNKGPYINDAIKVLRSVLEKIENQKFKTKNALRPLSIAKNTLLKLDTNL